jgi:hypothetical protein
LVLEEQYCLDSHSEQQSQGQEKQVSSQNFLDVALPREEDLVREGDLLQFSRLSTGDLDVTVQDTQWRNTHLYCGSIEQWNRCFL